VRCLGGLVLGRVLLGGVYCVCYIWHGVGIWEDDTAGLMHGARFCGIQGASRTTQALRSRLGVDARVIGDGSATLHWSVEYMIHLCTT